MSRLVIIAVLTALVLPLGHVWMSLTSYSYAKLHLFILAPVAFLYLVPPRPLGTVHPNVKWFGYTIMAVLAVVALVYSVSGWDHIVYKAGVVTCSTSYGTLNAIPIEEWFWCLDHTLLACLWVMSIWQPRPVSPTRGSAHIAFRAASILVCLAMACYGYYLQEQGNSVLYLGLAFLHTFPILALQFAIAGHLHLQCLRECILGAVIPSVYVIVVDYYAIQTGIWEVTPQFSTGYYVLGARIEHIVMYTLTSAMASQGIVGLLRFAETYQVLRKKAESTSKALSLTFVWGQ